MKKVDVFKFGMDIKSEDTGNGGIVEAKALCNIISDNHEIEIKDDLSFSNDTIFIINGAIHRDKDKKALELFNNSKAKKILILCDPQLLCNKVKYDLVITQTVDTNGLVNKYKCDVVNFPFEKYPLMKTTDREKTKLTNKLVYFGGWRNGAREEKFEIFLEGQEHLTLIGKFPKKISENYYVVNRLPHNNLMQELRKHKFTVIFGDEWHDKYYHPTQRIYESIQSGLIPFIDIDFDKGKKLGLSNYFYVRNKKDVKRKIEEMSLYPKLYEEIEKTLSNFLSKFEQEKYLKKFNMLLEE